jgi:hypothetical protein
MTIVTIIGSEFWESGMRYLPDGRRLAMCSRIYGPNANIKPGSIFKSLRGFNAEPAARMTRREYTEIFPGGRPYKEGEIQITVVPGLDRNTPYVSKIRLNSAAPRCRASSASAEERVDFHLREEDCERTPPDGDFAFEAVLSPEGVPSTERELTTFELDDFVLPKACDVLAGSIWRHDLPDAGTIFDD